MASTMLAFHGLAISGVALSSPVSTRIQYNSKSNGLQGSFLGQTLALRKDRLSIYPGNDRSHLVVYANAESTSGGGFLSSFMDYFRNLTSPKPAPSSNGATYAEEQRQDRRAVLVVGSTGRTGRHVVAKLLAKGHDVLALVGSLDRFKEVLVKEMGLKEGKNGGAKLTPVVGDALSGPEVLAPIVDQSDAIICALGSRTQAPSSREPSLLKATYTSGVINFIKAAQSTIKKRPGRKIREEVKLFDFSSSQVAPAEEGADVAVPGWKSMNDVMVGGTSTSTMVLQDGHGVYTGTVVEEKVGFAATRGRIENGPLDLSTYDGISLRVKGDGNRYKCSLRTSKTVGENSYQSSFDTVHDEWVTVDLPFDRFRAVNQGQLVDQPPLPLDDIVTLDLLLSKYAYDGFPNLVFTPGAFKLEVASVCAYRAPRPEFVLMGSAAVERFARLTAPEERNKSIPIVQLNPGGILTWKLASEDALRSSGLFYTNVRAVGLNDDDTKAPCPLEVAQGDALTGLISREEAAAVLVEALESPDTVGTTFEVRRDQLAEGLPMKDWTNLFRRLRPDVRPGIVAFSPSPALTAGNMVIGPPREVERAAPDSKVEAEAEKVPA